MVGKRLPVAVTDLDGAQLVAGLPGDANDYEQWDVVQQNPAPGSLAAAGSTVTLVLSPAAGRHTATGPAVGPTTTGPTVSPTSRAPAEPSSGATDGGQAGTGGTAPPPGRPGRPGTPSATAGAPAAVPAEPGLRSLASRLHERLPIIALTALLAGAFLAVTAVSGLGRRHDAAGGSGSREREAFDRPDELREWDAGPAGDARRDPVVATVIETRGRDRRWLRQHVRLTGAMDHSPQLTTSPQGPGSAVAVRLDGHPDPGHQEIVEHRT